VVELGILPVALGVAVGAVGTEAALVLVVFLVAGIAIGRGVAEFLCRHVAVAARDLGRRVRVLERKIGNPVVKGLFVERRDVHGTSLVVGVAGTAFLFLDAAVVTFVLLDILGHVLVTVEAQAGLRRLVEAHVAILAVAFKIRMTFNHLARHQHAFDRFGLGPGRRP
jgi:hypothetical protein